MDSGYRPSGGPVVEKGAWYPEMPPRLDDETDVRYLERLRGHAGRDLNPYDHKRFRHCSVGMHNLCSDPAGETCECPCHRDGVWDDAKWHAFYADPQNREFVGPAHRGPTSRRRDTAVNRLAWWVVEV